MPSRLPTTELSGRVSQSVTKPTSVTFIDTWPMNETLVERSSKIERKGQRKLQMPLSYPGNVAIQISYNVSGTFTSISMSSNGSYVYAVSYNGLAMISNDSGLTWRQMPIQSSPWISISTSATGKSVIATRANNGSPIQGWWLSTNYGRSWTPILMYANVFFGYVSGNEQYVAASDQTACCNSWNGVSTNGKILISNTSGLTWPTSSITSIPYANWIGAASSYSGNIFNAASKEIGIYRSTNFGSDWFSLFPNPSCYTSITSDSTGMIVGATSCGAGSTGCVYISSNGSNWESKLCYGTWATISTDSTGQFWTAAQNGGSIFQSNDYGSTWNNLSYPSRPFTASATTPGTGKPRCYLQNYQSYRCALISSYYLTLSSSY